jgi:hypothetical protein
MRPRKTATRIACTVLPVRRHENRHGGREKPSSRLSKGARVVFTASTESSEIACALHLKIPNVPTRGRDTVKRKVREEQEKNMDTLLYGPMDEAQAAAVIRRLEG